MQQQLMQSNEIMANPFPEMKDSPSNEATRKNNESSPQEKVLIYEAQ